MKTDPGELFRDADRVPAPDLWSDIERRHPDRPTRSPRRLGTIALAFVVAAVGVGFGVATLRERTAPGQERSPGPGESATPAPTVVPDVSASVSALVHVKGLLGPVAAADGSVWVVTYDEGQGAVVHIDATTNEVVAVVPIGGGYAYNIAAGAGLVWVPIGEPDRGVELLRIDASTNEISGRLPGVTGPVVVEAPGVWAVEDGPGENDAAVVRIDPNTLEVQARVPTGEVPLDMAAGGGSVWVLERAVHGSDVGTGNLLRIDFVSGTLAATIPILGSGIWIAADDSGVWAGIWERDTSNASVAAFIDASTNERLGEPGDVYNFRPFAVAEGRVWFISGPHDPGLPDGGICGLNIVTRTVDACAEPKSAADLSFAHDPAAFEPVTHSIWTGAYQEHIVTRIDVTESHP